MKKFLIAGVACAGLLAASSAYAAPPVIGPAIGADSSANLIIELTNSGVVLTDNGFGPYDGSEDTYIGVANETSSSVNAIHITSTLPIFGDMETGLFGDGIGAFPYLNHCYGVTCYEGPNTSFTISDGFSGFVNFTGGLAPGATAYFSLEFPLSTADFQHISVGAPEPATWAMMLLGFFGLGGMVRSRRGAASVA
jgi:hypothetical protein